MVNKGSIGKIITALPELRSFHIRPSSAYDLIDEFIKNLIQNSNLSLTDNAFFKMGPYGTINFPFVTMGAINSLDLFGLDELIIFSYYWKNKDKYKIAVDIGANIGLHSIMMAKCGWSVTSYEPDPIHFNILKNNLALNNISNVILKDKAVSDIPGTLEFIRVIGNTTGSHLAGSKSSPYGDLDKFPVEVDSFKNVISNADFVKVDAEGHETNLILSTDNKDWEKLDMIAEIGTEENAKLIYNHFSKLNINLFSQKIGWEKVTNLENMPRSHKEGSVFVSMQDKMFW